MVVAKLIQSIVKALAGELPGLDYIQDFESNIQHQQ